MQLGITMFPTDYSIGPAELARACEERGFESLFVPEHTHIPASRRTPYPGGTELPKEYSHTLDPFAALAGPGWRQRCPHVRPSAALWRRMDADRHAHNPPGRADRRVAAARQGARTRPDPGVCLRSAPAHRGARRPRSGRCRPRHLLDTTRAIRHGPPDPGPLRGAHTGHVAR